MIKKIVTLAYLLNVPAWAGELYTLDDLRALQTQKNFNEFLEHVNDIRPSQRLENWQSMYRAMLLDLMDYKIKLEAYDKDSFKAIENHASKSHFKNDERVQLKRNLYAKNYFNKCYKTKEDKSLIQCDDELKKFWTFSNNDSDLGLEFSKMLQGSRSKLDSWEFIGSALSDKGQSFYCNNPDIQHQILNRFTSLSFQDGFDNNYKKLITNNISQECFLKMKDFLKSKLLASSTSSIDRELALNLLSSNKMLSDLEEDVFAVLYLSDGPVVGDKMNLAWKRVEALGLNQTKRQSVLKIIQGLPQIADYTLKNPDNQRNKAIINLLATHFPEFLNHYGKECLSYISFNSDEKTQVRNRQCQNFLEMANSQKSSSSLGPNWVSDVIKIQFSSLKKKK